MRCFHAASIAKGSVPCGTCPGVYQGAQATVVPAHVRPHLVTAWVRPRRAWKCEYAKRDKSTSCLNSVGATSHCLRRDKAPPSAAPGSAVTPGSCQCFGSGAQPAWHLHVSWQLWGSMPHMWHRNSLAPREQLALDVIQDSRSSWAPAGTPNAGLLH